MTHGGRRSGAGRPRRAATRRTREIADRAIEEGITPLEVMLDNMRSAHSRATLLAGKLDKANDPALWREVMQLRQIAQEAAKDAAPYMHPRLAAVAHAGNDSDGPVEFTFKIDSNDAEAA